MFVAQLCSIRVDRFTECQTCGTTKATIQTLREEMLVLISVYLRYDLKINLAIYMRLYLHCYIPGASWFCYNTTYKIQSIIFRLFVYEKYFQLSTAITFNARQQPIKLPTSGTVRGESVTIVAWGSTGYRQRVHNDLQKLDARVMLQDECQRYHQNFMKVHPNEFCTLITHGTGACNVRNYKEEALIYKYIPLIGILFYCSSFIFIFLVLFLEIQYFLLLYCICSSTHLIIPERYFWDTIFILSRIVFFHFASHKIRFVHLIHNFFPYLVMNILLTIIDKTLI